MIQDSICRAILTEIMGIPSVRAINNGYYAQCTPRQPTYPFIIISDMHLEPVQTIGQEFYHTSLTVSVHDLAPADAREGCTDYVDIISNAIMEMFVDHVIEVDSLIMAIYCEGCSYRLDGRTIIGNLRCKIAIE